MSRTAICYFLFSIFYFSLCPAGEIAPLPNTAPLTLEGDIASHLVDGVDKFLLREIDKSVERRAKFWKRDFSSAEAYNKSIEPNRQRLAHILGVRDKRIPFAQFETVVEWPFRKFDEDGNRANPAYVCSTGDSDVFAVRWPVVGNVHGEGLLIVPAKGKPVATIIAIPDADVSPEDFSLIHTKGIPNPVLPFIDNNFQILIPALISRGTDQSAIDPAWRKTNLTHREFLYRSAFELGRGLAGYEIQKILAAVDFFDAPARRDCPIGVLGWGEGGMLALYSAALDTRIKAAWVAGYFENRNSIWRQPIERNVFGLLEQFGDAELAAMIAPRKLVVEACQAPVANISGKGAAPAVLATPKLESMRGEVNRAKELAKNFASIDLIEAGPEGTEACGSKAAVQAFATALVPNVELEAFVFGEPKVSRQDRLARQVLEIDRHNQWLLSNCADVRKEFMKKLDFSSPEKYAQTSAEYRKIFSEQVIGKFDEPLLAFNARSRKKYDTEKWTGYEVVLDVFPDVIAYGVLLLPKDLKEGEKRPVVVCQHGLEGRPKDVIEGNNPAYHDYAAKLCERGFITFAPQNLYIFTDRFRTLQRKANPLGKTLFSIITPQHQQIINWLKTLPNVDPQRIAFYGLSYGGKTAMRVPALLTDYCLSICSADFNEWVWKNASTRSPYSYVWTGEYEIFEFDLGSTFNYAEMAALIAPRPFMVERGHFDGVAPDETVGYEFAKVRFLYEAKLKLDNQCEIEWFTGPHTINGKGTFDFLHKHLKWEKK